MTVCHIEFISSTRQEVCEMNWLALAGFFKNWIAWIARLLSMYCEEARLKICLALGVQGGVCTNHYFPVEFICKS